MKPNVVLVNTARGGTIEETALAALAPEGPAMRIALDTFAAEPLPAGSLLRDLPNTILTPHMLGHTIVGHTVESHAVLPGASLDAVTRVLAGEALLHVRNPDVIPSWKRRWAAARQGV
jgi:phosphoglycerate dehydrogenase-like enzyme